MASPENGEFASLSTLVGDRLIGVQFIMDYLKLNFDAAEMTILSAIQVSTAGLVSRSFQAGFRDQICSLIGSKILEATGVRDKYLELKFEGDASICISLKPEDREGPETVMFETKSGVKWSVW